MFRIILNNTINRLSNIRQIVKIIQTIQGWINDRILYK